MCSSDLAASGGQREMMAAAFTNRELSKDLLPCQIGRALRAYAKRSPYPFLLLADGPLKELNQVAQGFHGDIFFLLPPG